MTNPYIVTGDSNKKTIQEELDEIVELQEQPFVSQGSIVYDSNNKLGIFLGEVTPKIKKLGKRIYIFWGNGGNFYFDNKDLSEIDNLKFIKYSVNDDILNIIKHIDSWLKRGGGIVKDEQDEYYRELVGEIFNGIENYIKLFNLNS